jgi:FkbH-like protein
MNDEAKPAGLLRMLRSSLARDRGLSVSELARKGVSTLAALATAPVHLRECDRVGARPRTHGRPIIDNRGRIEIGDECHVNCAYSPVRLHTAPGAELLIGDRFLCNFGVVLSAEEQIVIGRNVGLAPYVTVMDHDEGGVGDRPAPVVLEDDVWLASRVQVKKGVTIGKGTVVTAGSIVTTSLPPGVLAGGVPARVIRSLDHAAASGPAPREEPPREAADRRPDLVGLVVADWTAQELGTHLAYDDGLGLRVAAETAPFDQVVQTLHSIAAGTAAPDFVFLWTRPERVSEAFARRLAGETASLAEILAEVDAFADLVRRAAAGTKTMLVASWVLPPHRRGLGTLDLKEAGHARALLAMNLRLAERLDAAPSIFVLDASRWVALQSKPTYDPRLWYLGKVGWSKDVLAAAAEDARATLRGVRGLAKKLIVLDLDDTLWGGIVGDVGWQNLRLGGHDPIGEAFVDFQRELLALSRRGIALAVVSKNEESVALEAIRSHPEMVLREKDLAAWRINWNDKAQNVHDLVKQLNLGLQSVVFIDDNPRERARVREALPEVFVPEWPDDKTEYARALLRLRCFDVPHISAEDQDRTRMYVEERQREQLKGQFSNLDDWLAGLGTRVRFAPLDEGNLPRVAQLLNKTNQMNLRTRRLGEAELLAWSRGRGRELWAVSVSDKLGDAGLTGILGLEQEGDAFVVVDYVLSCRVMGRRVEETLVAFAVERARAHGLRAVRAPYFPTAKNKPCLAFWEKASGFRREGDVFSWDCAEPYARPRGVEVEVAAPRDVAPVETRA